MLHRGPTCLARHLAQEEALLHGNQSEILDWERASELVARAGNWSEGLCHCRHVQEHLGHRCNFPLDHCLALGKAARYLVHAGLAQPINQTRALETLAHARQLGLVQMVDNVRHKPTFLCNCCPCCCEMLEGFRLLGGHHGTVTSNHVAAVDADKCNGCGKCAAACPLNALELVPTGEPKPGRPKQRVRVDPERCLPAPDHPDHRFRSIPITDSGPSRSLIPEHPDHRFRTIPITSAG